MDPAIFSQFGPWGVALALLLGGMWWMADRLKIAEASATKRHEECEARGRVQDVRIEALERRQIEHLADLTERGIAGLADSTAAIKRFLNDPITPPQAFAARRQP